VSAEREPQKRPRGIVVELIRLVLVALFTAGGWQVAQAVDAEGTRLLLFVVLGSLVGYVIGGIVGRSTVHAVSAVERDFQRIPASELLQRVGSEVSVTVTNVLQTTSGRMVFARLGGA
jgi:uncharacterized protein YacL